MTDDPAASSFAKAMALSIGTVSVLDKCGKVFMRIWCALALSLSEGELHRTHLGHRGY